MEKKKKKSKGLFLIPNEVHILAKELWVTVWLPPRNSKFMKSPMLAVMTCGLNSRAALPDASAPTTTVIFAPRTGRTPARAARAAANFIFR